MSCTLCDTFTNPDDQYRILYKDAHVFVMINLEPIKDGHVMILPIRHAEDLKDLTPEEAQAFLRLSNQCMDIVTSVYGITPMFMVNGWEFRTQAHLHAHVLPSHVGGTHRIYVAAEGTNEHHALNQEELRAMADRLRDGFLQKA